MPEIDDVEIPIEADAEVMRQLGAAWEGAVPVADLLDYARELGVVPPDERDGWSIVYLWGPEGEEQGLAWYHPDDDPLSTVDESYP